MIHSIHINYFIRLSHLPYILVTLYSKVPPREGEGVGGKKIRVANDNTITYMCTYRMCCLLFGPINNIKGFLSTSTTYTTNNTKMARPLGEREKISGKVGITANFFIMRQNLSCFEWGSNHFMKGDNLRHMVENCLSKLCRFPCQLSI